VLVENRPGAGGNLAADAVAKSAPDGYTLLVSFTSHTINATLYPKLPFDPVTDFTPISMIATVPSLLVGNPALPAQDLAALIALAKAKPDTLSVAIGGIGSSLHLAGEQLKLMADVRILNVPYKGTAPATARSFPARSTRPSDAPAPIRCQRNGCVKSSRIALGARCRSRARRRLQR